MSRSRSRPRSLGRVGAFGLCLAVVTTVAQGVAAAAPVVTPVAPQQDPLLTGKPVPVLPAATGQSDTAKFPAGQTVAWPAGAAEVTLAGAAAAKAAEAKVGNLPVTVRLDTAGLSTKDAQAVGDVKVQVTVRDRATSDRAGVHGLVLDVRRTDGARTAAPVAVSVDYSAFRYAFGGDWAQRLQVVSLPACATTTAEKAECRTATPVAATNDYARSTMTALVSAGATESVLALEAAADGPSGDYKATDMLPAGKWNVTAQTGDFSWTYEMRTPPVPGDLAPNLQLTYSSSSTDGKVASTNNQPGWIGEGWSLAPGYIERSYKPCADDGVVPKTGDLCWGTDNATMSLNGSVTPLVLDEKATPPLWRPKAENGAKVERLSAPGNGDNDGEYWRITTTDGTQYYFGRNRAANGSVWTVPVYGNGDGEPCHDVTVCNQAWRWNLDYVVDSHGNSMSYFYAPETNSYGANVGKTTMQYTRGGTLLRAEYGTRAGHEGDGPAPARVLFNTGDRCVTSACGTHDGTNWPDTPWDKNCASACTTNTVPTFWSTKRLTSINTQVYDGSYKDVDSWAFTQTYPDPGDKSSPALWLASIKHSGLAGTRVDLPPVTLVGTPYANRVDLDSDGLPKMNKYRITSINTESGGIISTDYKGADCNPTAKPNPADNGTRCYPVRWTPNLGNTRDDWFVKYVAYQVSQIDRVGKTDKQVTTYDYEGAGAWAYDDDPLVKPEHRSWTRWRGYENVRVRKGDPADKDNPQSDTRYHYFRGMNGDRKTTSGGTKDAKIKDSRGVEVLDDDWLAGTVRETIVYNGYANDADGPVISSTITDSWVKGPTATAGSLKAYYVRPGTTLERTAVPGGWRTTKKTVSYDSYGKETQTEDLGDINKSDDDQCVTTTYARNTGGDTYLIDPVSRIEKIGLTCDKPPVTGDDVVSDTKTSYDGGAWGAAPTAGSVTQVREISSFNNTLDRGYVADKTIEVDAYGRPESVTDANKNVTKTVYSPEIGLTKTITETNPANHVKVTSLNVVISQPVSILDANSQTTALEYDALGRLTAVWLPGRKKGSVGGPNVKYTYAVHNDAPTVVTTAKLRPNLTAPVEYALFDGFMRPRQMQQPTSIGGRLVTDTLYDSRGLVSRTNDGYHAQGDPGAALLAVDDVAVPAQTTTKYDGNEREVTKKLMSLGTPLQVTGTKYFGDHTDVTPPTGGTPTSTYIDAAGRTTEIRQITGPDTAQSTKYTYDKRGQIAVMTDNAGNQWTNKYDVRGQKIKSHDPDKGDTVNAYDDGGQLVSTTDARNRTVTYVYDSLGRKIEAHDGPKTGPLLTKIIYDTVARGHVTSSTQYVGSDAYTETVDAYDGNYRWLSKSESIPAVAGSPAKTYTSKRTYYPDGSLMTSSLPEVGDLLAETLTYDYNDLGQPTKTTGFDKYVTKSTYTFKGELTQLQFGGDVETDKPKAVWHTTHFEAGTRRVSESISQRELQGPDAEVGRTLYTYDPVGNTKQIKETAPGVTDDVQCLSYDALRQLKDAWTATDGCAGAPGSTSGGPAPYWSTFSYDTIGNRTGQDNHGTTGLPAGTVAAGAQGATAGLSAPLTSRTTTFPKPGQPRPHAPVSTTTGGATAKAAADTTFDYDLAGNTIRRPGPNGPQTMEWDALGNMTSLTDGGKTTTYVYDTNGKRLLTKDPSGTTLFLDGAEIRLGAATAKAAGPAATATRYYSQGDTPIAARTSAGLKYLMPEKKDTVSTNVDPQSLVPTKRRFAPFGESRGTKPAEWPGQRGFVGGVTDTASGLTRLGARDYDPGVGTFLSVDPILDTSDPQKLNPYSYAANNPTSMSDGTGLTMRIDDGVEMAEYYKTVQSRQTAGYSTAPPRRDQRTRDARNAYFGKPAPGAKRVIVRTHFFFPDDQGILVFRFFIHGHDHLGLLGDDRGFTSDLDVGYRYVVALDTWSGEMSVTFSPSATTEKSIRNHSTGIDVDVPVQHYPARDIGNDEQDRNKNAVMVNTDTPGKLSIGYSGMNSVLPCCQVQGKITLEKEQGGTRATVKGEKFPDLEVIQYRNEGVRDVGKDDMSWMQELATVGSQWGARDSTWHIPNK